MHFQLYTSGSFCYNVLHRVRAILSKMDGGNESTWCPSRAELSRTLVVVMLEDSEDATLRCEALSCEEARRQIKSQARRRQFSLALSSELGLSSSGTSMRFQVIGNEAHNIVVLSRRVGAAFPLENKIIFLVSGSFPETTKFS